MHKKGIFYGVITYVATFAFVTSVFIILFPKGMEDASLTSKFIWTQCLVFLVWFVNIGAALIGFNDERRLFGLAGLLPGAGLVTIVYSLFSFAIMVLASPIETNGFINQYHLLIQVTAFFIYFFLIFIFCIAFEGARSGQEWDNDECKNIIFSVGNNLKLFESSIINLLPEIDLKNRTKLKQKAELLQTKINTSLPNSGRQLSDNNYKEFLNQLNETFVQEVQEFENYKSVQNDEAPITRKALLFLDKREYEIDQAIRTFRN